MISQSKSNRIIVDNILACILSRGWATSNSNIAVHGLLRCGEHGCLGLFERHEYKVVGSSNRSILYLGRWAESYKHDICSPLPDKKIGAEGEVDRTLASSPTVTPRHTRRQPLEIKQRASTLLLRSTTRSRRHHTTRQRDTGLSSRTVTNRLSGVLVTHDDTTRLS